MKPSELVCLVHLGCARNLVDSELILARMAEEGLVVTNDPAHAHTVVLNTCSFIGPAREESERALEGLLEKKRAGELSRVVVAGCLVQRERHALEARFPEVDLFSEISDYRALARSVRSMADGAGADGAGADGAGADGAGADGAGADGAGADGADFPRYLEGGGLRGPEREGSRLLATPGSYAYLRISHGCDHTCSFCAIPSIRGPHRSKRPVALLEEARELLDAGVRELVLVAEDSTAWGRELGLELPDLLESLGELEGLARLRVMYAYPNRFPWRLATLLREHPKVCAYLDLPIQHAATPVLRAMRRAGSGEQVRAILDRLREEVPAITLRTTVLLGFPGERDEDAAAVVDLVREYGLGRLGAFTYSPEQGTPGYELEGRVPPAAARERELLVLAERDRQLERSQRALVGTTLEVLVDEVHEEPQGLLAVARPEFDAPEVDLVALVRGLGRRGARVGDLLRVRVTDLDREHNLLCTPAQGGGRKAAG